MPLRFSATVTSVTGPVLGTKIKSLSAEEDRTVQLDLICWYIPSPGQDGPIFLDLRWNEAPFATMAPWCR